MTTTPATRAWIQMHGSVVLWGFTGILGRVITLDALPLVRWRMVIVAAVLACVPSVWRGLGRMPPRVQATCAGIGVLVAAHWVAFYGAIKLANASVAVTCMALAPVFVALIEPAITGRCLVPRELFLGLAMLPGVALVVGGTPAGMRAGIAAGVLAALLAAIFSSLNKRVIEHTTPLTLTAVEMAAGVACLAFAGSWSLPAPRDATLLLALAIGCTLVPSALSLAALRHLTAFSAALAVNLEPIYTIFLAAVLLGEHRELTPSFYLGVTILLAAVVGHRQR